METQTDRTKLVVVITLFSLAAGAYFLWGHFRGVVEDTVSVPVDYVYTGVRTANTAKNIKVTFANPEMGLCPVCRENVNYESFASIEHKNYALCSDECAQKLQAHPDDFLPVAKP